MSILDLNLEDFEEPKPASEGEHRVRLVNVEVRESRKGGEYVNAQMEVLDEENVESLFDTLMLPDGSDERIDTLRKIALKRFCEAFGIPLTAPINLEAGIGNEARVIVRLETDPVYGDRARVQRYIGPA